MTPRTGRLEESVKRPKMEGAILSREERRRFLATAMFFVLAVAAVFGITVYAVWRESHDATVDLATGTVERVVHGEDITAVMLEGGEQFRFYYIEALEPGDEITVSAKRNNGGDLSFYRWRWAK